MASKHALEPGRSRKPGRPRLQSRLLTHYQALVEIAFHALTRMAGGDDLEAVHDLRVSLRSQRVLLGLFPKCNKLSEARARLGQAATLTGEVRDLEVSLALAEALQQQTGCGDAVTGAWQASLADARRALLASLHDEHLDDALEDAESAWAKTILGKRRKALRRRARKRAGKLGKALLAQAAVVDRDPAIEQWHALRLHGKRLRYWTEGFAELLTHRQRRRGKDLRGLQVALGSLHDRQMFEERFDAGQPMPAEWLPLFAAEQEKARHGAAGSLAQLRADW